MRENILEAKRRLPLPTLMEQLGHGDAAKKSARCPFHEDSANSFSVFQSADGGHGWKCFAGCGHGDEIDFLAKKKGYANGTAVREFLALAGVSNGAPRRREGFDWPKCVAAFTAADARELAKWRGLSVEFVRWLHQQGAVGLFEGKTAFANHGDGGKVVSAHVRLSNGDWIFKPKGQRTAPLIFGDTKAAGFVLTFESQWDAFAAMDRLGWHTENGLPDAAVLITRGASNGKLIRGHVSPDAICYAFKQNDAPTPEKPIPAGDTWLAEVAAAAGCRLLHVVTPAPHKDCNDWTKAGATKAQIQAAIASAKIFQPPAVETAAPSLDTTGSDFAEVTAWIRGETLRTLADKVSLPTVKNSNVAKLVVAALARIGRFYFHADLRDFDSALYFNAHTKRLERIRSDAFIAWLSTWLVINRASGLFKYVVGEVETAALSAAHTTGILPEAYFAARPGALYLSTGDGQAVKITADGVATVDNGSDGVLFAAGRTLQPWKLTTPRDAFETCAIFRNTHSSAAHGRALLQLWLYSFPTMPRSKPPLGAIGEIGSGKTRTLKGIAELYGFPFRAAKVEEQLEPNFWPNVNEGGMFILDNADSKCRWLADAVSSYATDGCSQRRKLYTNSETVTLRGNAWLSITSANPTFGNDAGLADRLIPFRMARSGEETSDAVLTDEILANRDAGLSHLAATLRAALADDAPTPPSLNKRHPDFAAFAVRIGRALGREGEAVAALRQAEQDKSAFCLENDTIGAALIAYLRTAREFHGTAAELVPKLVEVDSDLAERLSAKRLGKRLAAIWPHLQAALTTARRETDRKRFTVFQFQSAEFAEFQMDFSQKS